MGVEGRWTLQRCGGCDRLAMGRHRTEWCLETEQKEPQISVPVVPCDDAAVERVARYLHIERFGTIDTAPCASCVDTARAVLRAAGG